MEWFKDKKNMPIIAVGGAVVLLLIVGALYFFVFSGGSGGTDTAATTDQAAATADPNAVPTDPNAAASGTAPAGTPGQNTAYDPAAGAAPAGGAAPAAGAAPAGGAANTASSGGAATTVAAQPIEAWRDDPFQPVGYKPQPTGPKPKPRIEDFPIPDLPRWRGEHTGFDAPQRDLPQPVRRMSGILLNDRVYAIIETNGRSEIVQPGARLEGGLATVERIEADRVVLRTADKKPRYIVVRMAAAPRTAGSSSVSSSTTSPYGGGAGNGMYPPGMPGPRRGNRADAYSPM